MSHKPRRFDLSPDNFIAGISGQLSASELGLYWLICLLIYSHGGPVEYDESRFSRLLKNTHWRTIKRASERLQELGKIDVRDGHVMAKGCAGPLQDAVTRVSMAVKNGSNGGRPPNKINEIPKPDGFFSEKLARVAPSPPPPPSSPKEAVRSSAAAHDSCDSADSPSSEKRSEQDARNFHALCDLLGYDAKNPREWLAFIRMQTNDGLDFERHIWPAAERVSKSENRGKSIAYLKPAAVEIRDSPAVPERPPPEFEDTDLAGWRKRARIFLSDPIVKPWKQSWGGRPDQVGSDRRMPPEVLSEFGFPQPTPFIVKSHQAADVLVRAYPVDVHRA